MNLRKLFSAPLLALQLMIAGFAAPTITPAVTTAVVASVATASAVFVGSAVIAPEQAQAAALSNYLENKLVDAFLRGQTFTMPTTVYVGLATTTGSDAACGTEVATGSYARVSVTSSLTNWAGTQSSASTTASSGTGGTTSNNAAITFPAPTANWATVTEFCVFDASTAGNLLFRSALTTSKTVNNGDAAPSFAISALTLQIDN